MGTKDNTAAAAVPGADAIRRTVEALLPAALERAELVGEMRSALERGDEASVIPIARRLCGLPPVQIVP